LQAGWDAVLAFSLSQTLGFQAVAELVAVSVGAAYALAFASFLRSSVKTMACADAAAMESAALRTVYTSSSAPGSTLSDQACVRSEMTSWMPLPKSLAI
jgi:hypothetical protein